MTGHIIIAPTYSDLEGPMIFLAGPIQGTYDWQAAAIEYIHSKVPNLHIASPRRLLGTKGNFTGDIYNGQIDWETHYIRRASKNGAIMFWLAKEFEHKCERAYAQTSRFELGECKIRYEKEKINLIIGIEEGFTNERYIKRRMSQDCPEIPILNTLEDTCKKAIEFTCNLQFL